MAFKHQLPRLTILFCSGIFALMLILALTGVVPAAAFLAKFEFTPMLMTVCSGAGLTALVFFLLLLVVTFIFGRFYCAVLCPVGLFQELVGLIGARRKRHVNNLPYVRYAVAGIVFGLLFSGSALGFIVLDPYSNFARALVGYSLGSLLFFVLLAGLAVWKKRLFCTMLCPVGTVLGLAAKHGIVRMKIGDACVKCGKCAAICPANCIDLEKGVIDNERCLRCLDCISPCPFHGIHFGLQKKTSAPEKEVNLSRRHFLRGAAVVAGTVALGAVIGRKTLTLLENSARKLHLLPPGAMNEAQFMQRCTNCQLCVQACPAKIIQADPTGVLPVYLNFEKAGCQFDCNKCSQMCPNQAIAPLSLERKQRCRIGLAQVNAEKCVGCGLCTEVCPREAVELNDDETLALVDAQKCIGCGLCQNVCPDKAIIVEAIENQEFLKE